MIRISIIIATYNRGARLGRTLESLAAQRLDPPLWEAVVVNNNSTDDTAAVFERFAAGHPHLNLRMVDEPRQGLSHARNRGIAESSGELIAVIDDDEMVNEGFAEAYIAFFDTHPEVAAAGGRIIPRYEQTPPRWLSPIAERPIAGTLDMGPDAVRMHGERYPGGGNMAVRRSVIAKYGDFNPELGRTGGKLLAGEEKDLFRRLRNGGEQIWYVPGAQIWHIIPPSRLTRSYFTRLSRMIGVSERVRTRQAGGGAFAGRVAAEAVKWGATAVLALWYLVTLRPAKGGYLILLRWNVTLGLLGFGPKDK